MLTLLNGPRSIHLRSIARSILDHQKTWNFGNYTVKYKNNGFIVFDLNGNNVYCNNSELGKLNHDIFKNSISEEDFKEKFSIIDEINHFDNQINENIKNNHFIDSWPNTDLSFLFNHNLQFENDKTYEDIIESYQNSSDTDNIWTGRFSISFIEKIKYNIGAENIRVLNFIRNPSICAFTNYLDEDCKNEYGNVSILNMFFVSKLPEVININYEEFLTNKKFLLEDTEITLPNFVQNHNNLISEYEFSKYDSNLINQEIIDGFNKVYSDFDIIRVMEESLSLDNTVDNTSETINDFLTNLQHRIKDDVKQNIPKNIFHELNYLPLTIDEIIKK